ncbi:glycosyltransferase family 4 protein [Candidatus Uhrbacteria bacterium]|nr:glycosyltransferase family 4 protein [Candidatus Uhrbacteria bacterium]
MDKAQITIAHVVCTYPPYRGGMGNVARDSVERLRARGYNVHVFTIQDKDVQDDPRWVHRIPGILQIGNAGVLPSLFHRLSGFDLVHLHYPFFGGAEPVIVRKALRQDQGLVMTYHMDNVGGGLKGAVFGMHRRLLFPWLVNRVDRILVSSMDYGLHSALAELEVMDRIEEHPFGVDSERFHPGDEPELRARLRLPAGTPILLFVGGLDAAHAFKGLPVLFEALSLLRGRPWHLVIVGEGALKETYRTAARALGLEERVTFVGSASEADLPRYYRLADVHLFPSTARAESFGLVALEAAASGVPTIASALPGVRTLVRDGDTGILVPSGDASALASAIATVLEHPELRARLGLSARVMATTAYHWEPLIDRLEATYASVIQQQSKREYL